MANGYVRQSAANIVNGGIVNASDHNAEYDAIKNAFDATTGHTHDGTVGGGAPVSKWALGTSALTSPAGYIAGDTNTGIGQVGGADTISLIAGGSEAVRANGVASGVNYVGVTGATTGNPPAITFTGSDANVGGGIYTKGTGWLGLYPGGFPSLSVAPVTSAVNYVKATGAVTGASPSITFEGSDTNVGGALYTKGNGGLYIVPGGYTTAVFSRVINSVNYLQFTGAAAGGNPIISTTAGGLDIRAADGQSVILGSGQTGQYPKQISVSESAHATSRRATVELGSNWQFGQDEAGSGVKDFFLYCVGITGSVLRIATTGVTSFLKAVRGGIVALTDGATITPDFNAGNYFSVTLAGNRTLDNPSNLAAGQGGSITFKQDATGSRTLSFGSYWKFPGGTVPTLTTTANASDKLVYEVVSATEIHANLIKDFK